MGGSFASHEGPLLFNRGGVYSSRMIIIDELTESRDTCLY